MSIGAKDYIDVLLVQKYATMKVDNPVIQSSMINPDAMYRAMNDYAQAHLAMINLREKVRGVCIDAISGSIQYRKSRNLKKKSASPMMPQPEPVLE